MEVRFNCVKIYRSFVKGERINLIFSGIHHVMVM